MNLEVYDWVVVVILLLISIWVYLAQSKISKLEDNLDELRIQINSLFHRINDVNRELYSTRNWILVKEYFDKVPVEISDSPYYMNRPYWAEFMKDEFAYRQPKDIIKYLENAGFIRKEIFTNCDEDTACEYCGRKFGVGDTCKNCGAPPKIDYRLWS